MYKCINIVHNLTCSVFEYSHQSLRTTQKQITTPYKQQPLATVVVYDLWSLTRVRAQIGQSMDQS